MDMRQLVTFFLLMMPMLVIAKQGIGLIERRYNEFVKVDDATFGHPEAERIGALEKAYAGLFEDGSIDLGRATDSDMSFLFRAAQRIHFYTQKATYGEEMARYLDVMERRGIATPTQRSDYYRSLVSERRFIDAEAYAQASGIPVEEQAPFARIPTSDSVTSPSVLELATDGRSLGLRQLRIEDLSVVVVVTPWCHFARNGIRAIDADSEVAQALDGRATWLMPVEGNLDTKAVHAWNARHPRQPMVYAYDKGGWSMLPEWGTPTFYFFKDGRVIAQQVGWRSDTEGMAALRENLKKIGLLR